MDATAVDAIQHAAQLGRLDFASSLLGAVAILIALAAVFAFINVRHLAKRRATEVAERVSQEIAEKAANLYLQKQLPTITMAYLELLGGVGDQSADGIAQAQQQVDTDE